MVDQLLLSEFSYNACTSAVLLNNAPMVPNDTALFYALGTHLQALRKTHQIIQVMSTEDRQKALFVHSFDHKRGFILGIHLDIYCLCLPLCVICYF